MKLVAILLLAFASVSFSAELEPPGGDKNRFIVCENEEENIKLNYYMTEQKVTLLEPNMTRDVKVLAGKKDGNLHLSGSYHLTSNCSVSFAMVMPVSPQSGRMFTAWFTTQKHYLDVGGTIGNDPNMKPAREMDLSCMFSDVKDS